MPFEVKSYNWTKKTVSLSSTIENNTALEKELREILSNSIDDLSTLKSDVSWNLDRELDWLDWSVLNIEEIHINQLLSHYLNLLNWWKTISSLKKSNEFSWLLFALQSKLSIIWFYSSEVTAQRDDKTVNSIKIYKAWHWLPYTDEISSAFIEHLLSLPIWKSEHDPMLKKLSVEKKFVLWMDHEQKYQKLHDPMLKKLSVEKKFVL